MVVLLAKSVRIGCIHVRTVPKYVLKHYFIEIIAMYTLKNFVLF